MPTDFTFIKAQKEDFEKAAAHYQTVLTYLENGTNYPGWKTGVYPTADTARSQIENGQLYLAMHDNQIAGSIAITHKGENGYQNVNWAFDCPYCEIFVLHTLAVSPSFLRCGVGKYLLDCCVSKAKDEKIRAIRFDASPNNTPAHTLYQKCGFVVVGTTNIIYDEQILNDFMLFEKVI